MRMKRFISSLFVGTLLISLALSNFANATTTVKTQDVYRLYNPNTGEHFYTSSVAEEIFLNNNGWKYEGTAFVTATSGEPVYRVYNPNASGGDHYYTKSKGEATYLVSLGWHWDNNGDPVFYSSGNTSLYVAYNPNANSGAHNFTTSLGEQNVLLNSGWIFGAVAWQVEAPGSSSAPNPNTYLPEYPALPVDENEVGIGSRRLLYANKPFDTTTQALTNPTVSVSADIKVTGDSAYDALLGINGTSGDNSGQFGIWLKFDTGTGAFGSRMEGKLVALTYDFSSDKGFNDQFYSYNSSIGLTPGTTIHVEVDYFDSAQIAQTFVTVPGGQKTLVGQYHYIADVSGGNPFIIVPDAKAGVATNGTQGKVDATFTNISVYLNGVKQNINGTTPWYGFTVANNSTPLTMNTSWANGIMKMNGWGNGAYNGLFK